MKLSHRTDQNIYIISLEGDLASKNMNEIEHYITPLLKDENGGGIIINFDGITFIDSSGVGLVLSMFKTLQARDSRLALCQLGEDNMEIFEMTRLNDILSIYTTEEEALASF
ncbi:MAG: STAS domain-containing protein [SAR324 cluster bacterium]|nr:STAS domain-containing protein [SAR324 cluster bacterium]